MIRLHGQERSKNQRTTKLRLNGKSKQIFSKLKSHDTKKK